MRRLLIGLVALSFCMIGQAQAESGDQYWLAKAGMSWFDSANKSDSMKALNLTYGYGITRSIAAEIDYQQSAGGGRYENETDDVSGQYEYKVLSIGAAYRYVFYEALYFRGKLALAYGSEDDRGKVISSGEKIKKIDEKANVSTSLALGVLAGRVVGSSLTLELEYIRHSSNLSSVLLGANVTF